MGRNRNKIQQVYDHEEFLHISIINKTLIVICRIVLTFDFFQFLRNDTFLTITLTIIFSDKCYSVITDFSSLFH